MSNTKQGLVRSSVSIVIITIAIVVVFAIGRWMIKSISDTDTTGMTILKGIILAAFIIIAVIILLRRFIPEFSVVSWVKDMQKKKNPPADTKEKDKKTSDPFWGFVKFAVACIVVYYLGVLFEGSIKRQIDKVTTSDEYSISTHNNDIPPVKSVSLTTEEYSYESMPVSNPPTGTFIMHSGVMYQIPVDSTTTTSFDPIIRGQEARITFAHKKYSWSFCKIHVYNRKGKPEGEIKKISTPWWDGMYEVTTDQTIIVHFRREKKS